jgi:hypothetical protein
MKVPTNSKTWKSIIKAVKKGNVERLKYLNDIVPIKGLIRKRLRKHSILDKF